MFCPPRWGRRGERSADVPKLILTWILFFCLCSFIPLQPREVPCPRQLPYWNGNEGLHEMGRVLIWRKLPVQTKPKKRWWWKIQTLLLVPCATLLAIVPQAICRIHLVLFWGEINNKTSNIVLKDTQDPGIELKWPARQGVHSEGVGGWWRCLLECEKRTHERK